MLDPKNIEAGEEQFESYYSEVLRKDLIQYDYRDHDGTLFSCVAPDLATARARKKRWLDERHDPPEDVDSYKRRKEFGLEGL